MRHSCYNFSSVNVLVHASSGFVKALTCTFVFGFQKSLAKLFALMSRSAV